MLHPKMLCFLADMLHFAPKCSIFGLKCQISPQNVPILWRRCCISTLKGYFFGKRGYISPQNTLVLG